eukprot:TRINITY_DN588_c0_g1_i1.p1 TRINITY_DN588_c0_g1~~TRINITY_DN588_c0_g1_i1.p1  ORF type:complete len:212 (-),score=48.41 TRINITY_DN588_c0_g1_i1:60-695(-)
MAFLEGLFGKKKTPQEMMREYKRSIERTIRDLDRERAQLQAQEKKLIIDMKKMAKQDQMDSVKIMAKDLVRTRKYITKFYRMRAQMQAVALRLQTLQSTQAMGEAMKGVTRAMVAMNRQMNIPQMQRIMQEFEKQSEIMDLKDEMMNDAVDEVMGDEDDEEETEEVLSKVMDEIGLDLGSQLGKTPASQIGAKQAAEDADLQARLEALRKT